MHGNNWIYNSGSFMAIEILGWIGSTCLMLCGLPQAIQSYRQGHSQGINKLFLLTWFLGEIFTLVYVISIGSAPLLLNYFSNIIIISVIIKYMWWPRKGNI